MENGRDELRESAWPRVLFPKQYSKSCGRSSKIPSDRDDVARSRTISAEDLSSLAKTKPDTVDNKVISLARVSTNYPAIGFPGALCETRGYFENLRKSYWWRQAESDYESSALDALRCEGANRGDHSLSCRLAQCHPWLDIRSA